ncbi:hypothetical protein AURDEDRAFT_159210 [Auricularia subglabra TFB-10046 SS5]|nr:hypothetical protein AURDEDRAFT_159210 [Auricularia subglabra TFB-10046 SS5]
MEDPCIRTLFGVLCHPKSHVDDAGKLNIVRLILEEAALQSIVGPVIRSSLIDDRRFKFNGTGILAAITSSICSLLGAPETRPQGEQLFKQLAFTEVHRKSTVLIWDLGEWIRTHSDALTGVISVDSIWMQSFHDSMTEIFNMCATNDPLRTAWNRIGYPGRPGDVFSDPFLDIGAFFGQACKYDSWDDHW